VITLIEKDVEKEEYFIACVIENWYNHSGNQSGGSSENWK
jgi:DNA phosphorothioation-dependent restriction protein DptG